jgi:adenylosuccinate synthase
MKKPEVIVTMRTFPIRVGDAYDKYGNKVGTSGPVYDDQREVSWEQLGVPLERTTVTKKVRRVFTWSNKNLEKVVTMLAPDAIFLNFVNYLESNPSFESKETASFIDGIEAKAREIGHPVSVRWIGVGPKISDVLRKS